MKPLVYDLELEVLTPTFIGDGSKKTNLDYYVDERAGKVYYLEYDKFAQALEQNNLIDAFEDYARSGKNRIRPFVDKYFSRLAAKGDLFREISFSNVNQEDRKNIGEIQQFVRNDKGVYIPGSSIKGALRTAYLSAILLGKDTEKEKRESLDKKGLAREIEKEKLHKLESEQKRNEMLNDIFRAVSISDSLPIPDDRLGLSLMYDQGYDEKLSKPKSQNCLRETLKPGTKIYAKMTIDPVLLSGKNFSADTLMKSVKNFSTFYFKRILRENPLFVNSNRYANRYVEAHKNKLLNQPILFLGGGTGYITKTISYPYLLGKKMNEDLEKRHMEEAIDEVARTLDRRAGRHHHRAEDFDQAGLSPRMMKVTKDEGRYHPLGLVKMEIKESKT